VTLQSAVARETTALPAYLLSHTLLEIPVCSVLPSAPHAPLHINALPVGRATILMPGNACSAQRIARFAHLPFVSTAL